MTTTNSFQKVESININDENGNELEIVLCKNGARVWRIEFMLNGILLRPMKMTGSSAAMTQWQIVQNLTKKKGEKSEGKMNIMINHSTNKENENE